MFGKGTMLPLSGRRVNFRTEILRETPAMEAYENPWKAGERILVSRDSKSVFVSEGGWVLFSTEELSRAPDPALCPNTAGEFRRPTGQRTRQLRVPASHSVHCSAPDCMTFDIIPGSGRAGVTGVKTRESDDERP